MTVSAADAPALFAALTLYELDELIMRLTAGYRALVTSRPLGDPFRAETRDLLADAHRAWLAAYARGPGLGSIPGPRHEPGPAPRLPGRRHAGRGGGQGEGGQDSHADDGEAL